MCLLYSSGYIQAAVAPLNLVTANTLRDNKMLKVSLVPTLKKCPVQGHRYDVCGEEEAGQEGVARGCLLLPRHTPARPPTAVSGQTCTFTDENHNPANCWLEADIWRLIGELVEPEDTVLELGGRYATTTCALAVRLNNSARLVTVEPDPLVWAAHQVRPPINSFPLSPLRETITSKRLFQL